MDLISKNAETTSAARPAFYAGRFSDRLAETDLPGASEILGDWDVLPTRLDDILGRASYLVVLDLFSFPFEALGGARRDVPVILALPSGFDVEFLMDVFGAVAFESFGFFDRVATADDTLWEEMRRRYGWAGGQRLRHQASARLGITVCPTASENDARAN